MKLKIAILFLTLFFTVNKINAQAVYASTIKIGPFSLDMKNNEVDKILEKKLSAAELKKSAENFEKMIEVTVNGILYKLAFFSEYDNEGKPNGIYKISRIKCKNPIVKTKSGIAIGMDKFDVLKKLDGMNIGYRFYKNTEYDNDSKPTNKFIEQIEIIDTSAFKNLTLEIENNKISGFSLSFEEDSC